MATDASDSPAAQARVRYSIRLLPEKGICLVVTAGQDVLANTVTTGMFGRQLYGTQTWRPLGSSRRGMRSWWTSESSAAYHRNSRFTLRISADDSGDVTGEVFDVPPRANGLPDTQSSRDSSPLRPRTVFWRHSLEPYVLGLYSLLRCGSGWRYLLREPKRTFSLGAADHWAAATNCQQLKGRTRCRQASS